MRDNYDFSDAVKNPYAKKLKEEVTISIDKDIISYFKEMGKEAGISYENMINLYLYDCVKNHRQIT